MLQLIDSTGIFLQLSHGMNRLTFKYQDKFSIKAKSVFFFPKKLTMQKKEIILWILYHVISTFNAPEVSAAFSPFPTIFSTLHGSITNATY